jgi:hypothetical protein
VKKALFGGLGRQLAGLQHRARRGAAGSKGPKIGFFMYPNAENANGRYDSLEPDQFKYTITAKEIKA